MKSVAIFVAFLGGVYSQILPLLSSTLTSKILITRNGYKYEEHVAKTKDGYFVRMHRIPCGSAEIPNPDNIKEAVLVMHGFLSSSSDYAIQGPETSLAFLLADRNYDVWLCNARGNRYSMKHETKSPEDPFFWDFSWHEIAMIDIPCMTEYILKHTGQCKIHYIGHSQGGTAFIALNSMRPEFAKKVCTAQLMAPVVFVQNAESRSLAAMAAALGHGTPVEGLVRNTPFLPNTIILQLLGSHACQETSPTRELCENLLFLMGGINEKNLNKTAIPEILGITPAGASTGQTIHFAQMHNSGEFRQYDYGSFGNIIKYGQTVPPSYPLNQYRATTFIYHSNNDHLIHKLDLERLKRELNPNAEVHFQEIEDECFAHLDFLYSTNVVAQVYKHIIDNMKLCACIQEQA